MNPTAIGLRSIARKDASKLRRFMFDQLLEANWLAALVFRLYEYPGLRGVVSFALLLRPIARVLSARVELVDEHSLVLVYHYSNERRALARLCDWQAGKSGAIFYRWSIFSLLHGTAWLTGRLLKPRKSWQACRVSLRLVRQGGFLVGARQAEFLLLYAYFFHRLKKAGIRGRTFASSTESNPEIIAPVLAARALGNSATYVNHGFLDKDLGVFFHDQLIVDCQAVLERIERNLAPGSRPQIEWDELPDPETELRVPDFSSVRQIGIVGSITMRADAFDRILSECLSEFPAASITVRPHPNSACTGAFYDQLLKDDRVRIASSRRGQSLLEAARSWDFAIGGGTSAHVELLRAGVPTVYMDFDGIDPDVYGFIGSGILPEAGRVSEIRSRLPETYGSPAWRSKFRRFSGSPVPQENKS